MNRHEKKLKDLLAKKTLEYFKEHEGRTNAAQMLALKDLKVLQRSYGMISVYEVVKHQKEYFQLKQASENTWATMIRLEEEGKVPSCTVHPLQDDYGTGTRFMFEVYSYTLMEIYEGKHNDFLQLIIDKDK